MSYKVGDKVLIEGKINKIEYGLNFLVHVDVDGKNIIIEEDKVTSKTYEDGLADAWELARKIGSYEAEKRVEIFADSDAYHFGYVLGNFTPQVARAILEAYEESKAIKVGDVVEHFGKPVVVTRVSEDGTVVDGFGMGGFAKSYRVCECKKTGRHIDISSILEQIRGDE